MKETENEVDMNFQELQKISLDIFEMAKENPDKIAIVDTGINKKIS